MWLGSASFCAMWLRSASFSAVLCGFVQWCYGASSCVFVLCYVPSCCAMWICSAVPCGFMWLRAVASCCGFVLWLQAVSLLQYKGKMCKCVAPLKMKCCRDADTLTDMTMSQEFNGLFSGNEL